MKKVNKWQLNHTPKSKDEYIEPNKQQVEIRTKLNAVEDRKIQRQMNKWDALSI